MTEQSLVRLIGCWLVCLCTLLSGFAMASENRSKLTVNGRGVFTEFQLNYYLAELYTKNPLANTEDILASDHVRMELSIVADEWSKRRFSQYWSQALLINNPGDARKRYAEVITQWHEAFKDGLIKGDRVVMTKKPDHFELQLNEVSLQKRKQANAFNLFVNVWIGARPPSSEFKTGILGQPEQFDSLFNQHSNLAASQARKETIESWLSSDAEEKDESQQLASTANSDEPKSTDRPENESGDDQASLASAKNETPEPAAVVATIVAPDKPSTAAEVEKAVSQATKLASSPEQAAIADPKTEPASAVSTKEIAATGQHTDVSNRIQLADASSVADPVPATNAHNETVEKTELEPGANDSTEGQDVEAASPESKVTEKPPVETGLASNTPAESKTADETTTEEEAESPLLKIYRSNILTLTYQNLIYPSSAIDRGHEGKIMLKLTLNRKGKVKKLKFAEKSRYNSLNKAVEKAVSAASPYPAPPKKLRGKEINLTLPITFSLSG